MVVEIPADGLFDAFLELERRLPAELALKLARIDRVAEIVAGAVGDIGDQMVARAFGIAQQPVHRPDEHLDQIDVLPLVEPADVVGLGNAAFVENQIDGPGVVFHVEPVAHVLALPVDRERLAVPDIVDEQRDELLRELVGTVVVRAVGHHRGHAVGIVVGAYEVVGRGLGRAVRTVRLVLEVFREETRAVGQMMLAGRGLRGEGRLHAVGIGHLQGAVHLIGRDMIETARPVGLPVFAGHHEAHRLPVAARGLQQRQGAHHVRLGESERVFDGAVHVAFRGQVDDAVDALFPQQGRDAFEVADVHPDETVVGLVFDILEIGQVAGIGQLVEIDDPVVRIFVHEMTDHVASDEARAAGDH